MYMQGLSKRKRIGRPCILNIYKNRIKVKPFYGGDKNSLISALFLGHF